MYLKNWRCTHNVSRDQTSMVLLLDHDAVECHYTCTVESRDYASPFCMLALGKSGEGAYTRDRDISA